VKRLLCLFALSVGPTAFAEQANAVSFSGFVDLYGSWNPNTPQNHENFIPGTGTTATRSNELAINLVQVQWTRALSAAQPVGFALALVAGEGTDVVHAGEPGGASKFRYLYQASIAWRATEKFVIEGGVYPSHIGFEGFYSKDNWNYTRSWLGEFSPYYQAGVKGTYAYNNHWSAQLHVLNGWQLINDNNDGKAVGTQIAYSSDRVNASFNTFFGPELANDSSHVRSFGDVVASYKVTPKFTIATSIDSGRQDLPEDAAADWVGVAGYGRYAVNDRHAFAARIERFRDPDNGITGFAQTLTEGTLTYEFRPVASLILKFEGRHDHSTATVFNKRDGTTDTQTLAMISGVVTF